jgi:hypothetical protein
MLAPFSVLFPHVPNSVEPSGCRMFRADPWIFSAFKASLMTLSRCASRMGFSARAKEMQNDAVSKMVERRASMVCYRALKVSVHLLYDASSHSCADSSIGPESIIGRQVIRSYCLANQSLLKRDAWAYAGCTDRNAALLRVNAGHLYTVACGRGDRAAGTIGIFGKLTVSSGSGNCGLD